MLLAGESASSSPDLPCAGPDCEAAKSSQPVDGDISKAAAVSAPPPCPYCNQDPNRWRSQTGVNPPEIGGKTAAVIEGACGALIYGLKQDERAPPASLVKIGTALVVMDLAKLEDRVPISIDGWSLSAEDGSSIMGLEVGMNLSVEELLYGLLLPSGNDAALALADHLGGSAKVVALMNQRVERLGLHNTQFTNVDGRHNPGLYSSAFDMATLGREMMANPKLKQIAGTQRFMPNWNGPQLWNGNYLLYIYPGTLGVKTGYTEEASSTIVAAVERDGRTLYASVFGSWDAYWDVIRLFNWAFLNTRSTCPGNS
jgi:serine-type D-Ala-D-Ala carboxypeptidase (penicillin-binding protein 5/6)